MSNKVGAAVSGTAGVLGVIALAMAFIEPEEGKVNSTYVDAAGYATACSGNRSAAIPGAVFTDEECNLLLMADTITHVIAVRKLATVPLSDEEWIALTSFSFNVGTGALSKSTLLSKLNSGDRQGAAEEFRKWKHAGGRELRGLVVRRAREATLFSTVKP